MQKFLKFFRIFSLFHRFLLLFSNFLLFFINFLIIFIMFFLLKNQCQWVGGNSDAIKFEMATLKL